MSIVGEHNVHNNMIVDSQSVEHQLVCKIYVQILNISHFLEIIKRGTLHSHYPLPQYPVHNDSYWNEICVLRNNYVVNTIPPCGTEVPVLMPSHSV
jgi:hypothetical protein